MFIPDSIVLCVDSPRLPSEVESIRTPRFQILEGVGPELDLPTVDRDVLESFQVAPILLSNPLDLQLNVCKTCPVEFSPLLDRFALSVELGHKGRSVPFIEPGLDEQLGHVPIVVSLPIRPLEALPRDPPDVREQFLLDPQQPADRGFELDSHGDELGDGKGDGIWESLVFEECMCRERRGIEFAEVGTGLHEVVEILGVFFVQSRFQADDFSNQDDASGDQRRFG